MGKTAKTCTVKWTPQGDPERIVGWNIVINTSSTDPYASPIYKQVFVPRPPGTNYSAWLGVEQTLDLKYLLVDGGTNLYAWVQQVYRDGDSEWLSSGGTTALDDGIASADEINESATRKWAGESGADKTQTAIDGGIVTAGRLEVKADDGTTKAGIAGGGTGDSATRMWAGATYSGRATAPFRVTQGGDVYMEQGYVGTQAVPVATVADLTERTTANVTYTVASTGADFTTVQAAIDALPHVIDHNVVIQIDTTQHSTWSEAVNLIGFVGSGSIRITTSSANASALVWSAAQDSSPIHVGATQVKVTVNYLTLAASASSGLEVGCVDVSSAQNVSVKNCKFEKAAGNAGYVRGIRAYDLAKVYSQANADGANQVDTGHLARTGGVIIYSQGFGVTASGQFNGIVTKGFSD